MHLANQSQRQWKSRSHPHQAVTQRRNIVRDILRVMHRHSGNLAVLNSANSDGSQTLAAILIGAAPNSGSTQTVQVAIAHLFVPKASLIFGGSDTYSAHFNALGQAKSGADFYVY